MGSGTHGDPAHLPKEGRTHLFELCCSQDEERTDFEFPCRINMRPLLLALGERSEYNCLYAGVHPAELGRIVPRRLPEDPGPRLQDLL